MLAGAVRTYLNRFGVAPGRRGRGLHQQRRRLAHRARPRARPASTSRRSSTRRAEVPPRAARGGAGGAGCSALRRRRPSRRRRRRRGRARMIRDAPARRPPSLRPARRLRRLERRRSHLTSHHRRQAGLERALSPPSCPARCRRAWRRRRGSGTLRRSRPCLAEGMRAGAARRGDRGFDAPLPELPRADDETLALAPLWHVAGSNGKAFVDLQNDVTANGHRARRARRLPLRRASEALHHARHGDRPGQDLATSPASPCMAELTRRARSPRPAPRSSARPTRRSPSARSAGHHRGKDFRPTRLTPSHDWAAEQGAVLRRGRPVAARAVVSAARRDATGSRRSTREVKAVRGGGRRLRRLDPRQDRRAGPGRRRLPRPGLYQHLLDAAGRQGALRR